MYALHLGCSGCFALCSPTSPAMFFCTFWPDLSHFMRIGVVSLSVSVDDDLSCDIGRVRTSNAF